MRWIYYKEVDGILSINCWLVGEEMLACRRGDVGSSTRRCWLIGEFDSAKFHLISSHDDVFSVFNVRLIQRLTNYYFLSLVHVLTTTPISLIIHAIGHILSPEKSPPFSPSVPSSTTAMASSNAGSEVDLIAEHTPIVSESILRMPHETWFHLLQDNGKEMTPTEFEKFADSDCKTKT